MTEKTIFKTLRKIIQAMPSIANPTNRNLSQHQVDQKLKQLNKEDNKNR
ncbi:hypothetical protein [Paenilisteria weihenstephanensis]|nr:hypothetical protein [Listeria weihenstephanensis]